ncbi:MAG TPA: twin-arginine translocase TatA/TatE family subunit [Saprospiraceae bacterium]|nr:twin-arginine translocase TatA/TatE family subunit [Saprospiraceae bacterium]
MPGGQELIVIMIIVLLLFGGRKIPELMRGLGSGIREFNKAKNSLESEIKDGIREAEREEVDKKKKIER